MSYADLLSFVLVLAAVGVVLAVSIEVLAAMNVRRCGPVMFVIWNASALASFLSGLLTIHRGPPPLLITLIVVLAAIVVWRHRKMHIRRACTGERTC